jgi:hypothetical protein
MKKLIPVGVLLISFLLLVSSAAAAPRLLIKEASFDFGFAPQNSKVSHVFWLHSTGDDTLKILKVRPG